MYRLLDNVVGELLGTNNVLRRDVLLEELATRIENYQNQDITIKVIVLKNIITIDRI